MKLAVYSKWEEKRNTSFLVMFDYNPYAEVIDLRGRIHYTKSKEGK